MPYVDGFLLAVPKNKIEILQGAGADGLHGLDGTWRARLCRMHRRRRSLWRADIVPARGDREGGRGRDLRPGSSIATEDRRDAINKKVMADERFKGHDMPFDGKRMIFGGFNTLLSAREVAA